jgi:hypothetical protein
MQPKLKSQTQFNAVLKRVLPTLHGNGKRIA